MYDVVGLLAYCHDNVQKMRNITQTAMYRTSEVSNSHDVCWKMLLAALGQLQETELVRGRKLKSGWRDCRQESGQQISAFHVRVDQILLRMECLRCLPDANTLLYDYIEKVLPEAAIHVEQHGAPSTMAMARQYVERFFSVGILRSPH